MSCWSSCNAILYVYTYKNLANFKELIERVLENAPQITGSEGNCTYLATDFVSGSSSSRPCHKCPYANQKVHTNRACSYTRNFPCESWSYIDRLIIGCSIDRCKIIITDTHGLRDKTKEETIKEFKKLVKYLKTIFKGVFEVEVLCKKIT